ncbi:MAG: DUF2871 domain-containing protein [Aurantimicrobium sp.]
MMKLFYAAFTYMVLGVLSGLFYREFTKLNDFPEGEFTQLGLVHTHLLALGFLVFLIVLTLEKLFTISASKKLFGWFFWLYNAGVVLAAATMVWNGMLTVEGKEYTKMIAGIAGNGHMLITAGLIVFFIGLGRAVKKSNFKESVAS